MLRLAEGRLPTMQQTCRLTQGGEPAFLPVSRPDQELHAGALPCTGAGYLFGGCSIRHPGPRCGAAGAVGPHFGLVLELFQDEPDGLVTDAWHGRPDVCQAERDWCVAQDVFADALLL